MSIRPWSFAGREAVSYFEQRRFAANARRKQQQEEEDRKKRQQTGGGGGFLDRVGGFVDAMTPEFVEGPAKAVGRGALKGLEYLDKPADLTLRPLMGALTYLGAQEVTDPKTGHKYRKAPTFGDLLEGWKELATQSPVESYQEGRQAFRERLQNPNLTAGSRFFLGAASDPLTYLGPGAAKAGARILGGARAAEAVGGSSRAARLARALIENESRGQSLGILAGGTVGAETAQRLGVPAPELTGGLAGGLAGAIAGPRYGSIKGIRRVGEDIAKAQGREGRAPALGLSLDETPERPVKRPGVHSIRSEDIEVREEDFQIRDKKQFEPRVKQIVDNFDPNRMTPGQLVYDMDSGKYVVIAGHHRLEAAKRMAKQGKYPESTTWEVFDADLTNPGHLTYLQELANIENMSTAELNFGEQLRAYRWFINQGRSHEDAIAGMRSISKRDAEDLRLINVMPEDIIARVVEEKNLVPLAAELGRAKLTYDLKEADIKALWARYHDTGITRLEIQRTLERYGEARGAEKAAKAQGGFGGAEWEAVQSDVLDDIDRITALEKELQAERRNLVNTRKGLLRSAGKRDEGRKRRMYEATAKEIEDDIKVAEEAIEEAKTNFKAALERRARGEAPEPPPAPEEPAPPTEEPRPSESAYADEDPAVRAILEGDFTSPAGEFERGRLRSVEQTTAPIPDWVRALPDEELRAQLDKTREALADNQKVVAERRQADPSYEPDEEFLLELKENMETEYFLLREQGDRAAGRSQRVVAGAKEPQGAPGPEQAPEQPPLGPETEPPPEQPRATPEPPPEHPGGEFAAAQEAAREAPPSLDTSNDYTILGLDPGSYDATAIRNAYRAQARRYHPDINTSATATEDMKAINGAFDALSGEAAAHGTTSGTVRRSSSRATRSRRSRYNQEQRSKAQAEREWRQSWEKEQRDNFRKYKEDRAGAEARAEEEIKNRPEGEPERVDIPDGARRTVEDLRNSAPLGYRLVVPTDELPPYYRRVLTNDTIRELRRHPQPPPVTPMKAREWFGGIENVDDAIDRWYEASIRWHPRFVGPTDTLTEDFAAMRRAAHATIFQAFKKQMMGEIGIDASDLRDMSREAKMRFAREISRATREAMDDVEKQVLREHWFEPLRPHMGKGFTESTSDYGMTGEGVTPESTAGEPPLEGGPPPETPPPPKGKGGTQEFGATEPTDLFHTPPRADVLAGGAKNTLLQKLGDKLRKVLFRADPDSTASTTRRKVDPIIKEHRRRIHLITHLVQSDIDLTRAKLAKVGLEPRVVEGRILLFVDGQDVGFFDDVLMQSTDEGKAAFNALRPEQQDAIAYIENSNRLFNETKQANGATQALLDTEGVYFGRRPISRVYEAEGGERVLGGEEPGYGPSRRVGAQRTHQRVFDSAAELYKAGFREDDPWTARTAIQRAKLLDADDAWIKKNLEVLRVNKEPLRSTVGLEQIGHPAFNGQWYEPKIARYIKAKLEPKKPAIPLLAEVNRVLTPLRSSFDFSATFQQGLRLWTSNPKAAAGYWWQVTRSLKEDKIYQGALLNMDERARTMGFDNGLMDLISYGNRYTGASVGSEFTLPSDVLAKWGKTKVGKPIAKGFKLSNAHFDRTLNLYRLHMALNQAERVKALALEPAAFDETMKASARAGNRAFGWTETETTGLEDSLVFAARYTRATAETLIKAVTDGGLEGIAARRHMALMLSEGAGLVWIYNTLRGHETTWDPTDPNFLRFRDVAGLDVSPFGTYNTLFRAVAQVIASDDPRKSLSERRPTLAPLKRFAEGKLAPALALAWWPAKGETYLGEPLDWNSPEAATRSLEELSSSFLPFTVQTTVQEGPLSAGVSAFGLSNTPVTPTEHRNWRRDVVAKEKFGSTYDEITGAQKAEVNRDEEVMKHQAEADRNALTRKWDRSAQVKATTEAASKLDALSADLEAKTITGNDFRDQYRLIQAELRGARDAIGATSGGDKVLSGWFDLYDAAERPSGQIDYEALDQFQADYRAKHPDVDERLLKAVGAHDSPTMQRYREAQKVATEYYSMPAYRGMNIKQSREATDVLMSAQDRVSFGQARNMKHALRLIAVDDPEGAKLARRAQRVGPNPERRRFRQRNPLLAEFYSDI